MILQITFLIILISLNSVKTQIIGGEKITIQRVPYLVSVRYKDKHRCGGSILDEYTILTAAHCVKNKDYRKFSIRLGHDIHSQGDSHEIDKIIEHKYYNDAVYDYDIAVLKIKNVLIFTKQIQPIQLQPKDTDFNDGSFASVSGWGAMHENHSKYDWPDSLKITYVRLLSNMQCQEIYDSNTEYQITKNMICALTLNHDACRGDSGGPLTLNGKLIGVVSWGIGCADPRFPGVYVRISVNVIYDWIFQFMTK